jgi:predicted amidophosphoribosyltransferase
MTSRPKTAGASGVVCPACSRGFDAGTRRCPHDGEELVPIALRPTAPPPGAGPASKGKICPTCGGRFEGNAAFCGKDGTALVMLN